ncbi:N-acetylmuramoyl-L-alanine amidase [Blastococcus mobilis]|uniref:N-acetylmuramoyl-L-alanine amidase n=1 Tax=Blastococcus mobilis TaxID=1938746 RepID=A0A238YRF8_9ACTN|nr:N-acetylmuramoyl-L-alanine amidase [Blastococcus mobilis]SNR73717.1 N-acetylmuramoyl-L-alanine amidase [Blastococcus mobilis]
MRRVLAGFLAFTAITATLLILPVYAAPSPTPKPVEASIDSVALGSATAPEGEAVVTTDGEVVAAGELAPVTPEPSAAPPPVEPAPPAAMPSTPTAPTSAEQPAPASSGDEVPGVPALTVSRPETDVFSTVGVTWSLDGPVSGVTAQVRVKDKSGKWGRWSDLEMEDAAAVPAADGSLPAGGRGGTAPYWTGDAYGIELVLQTADGSTPQDVQLELIDPGTSPADSAPGKPTARDQAQAGMYMPGIYSRAQWGADERLRTWAPEYAPTLKAATIHHTADRNTYTREQVPEILRATFAYHAVSLKWGDIGYNVLVDKFGRAWEGRYGGLASTVIGAHAGGFNTGTFGVSMMGNYDVVEPPRVMLDAVAHVIAWKLSLYRVSPHGTTTLTSSGGGTAKYATGVSVNLPTIFGHRDVGSTACPGRYAFARMSYIRSTVAAMQSNIGLYEPAEVWTRSADQSVTRVHRGNPGDVPLTCDWDGDGRDTVGLFRRGQFILFDSNSPTAPITAAFYYGNPTDIPLCGDWDGDGDDTVAVWRGGQFFLRNANSSGVSSTYFAFGNPTDAPLAGDWDGDGADSPAVHRDSYFFWTNSDQQGVTDGYRSFGLSGDRPVTGDWDGDGADNLGVARAGVFYLADRTAGQPYDYLYYGNITDNPVAGDWDDAGTDEIGVSRGY